MDVKKKRKERRKEKEHSKVTLQLGYKVQMTGYHQKRVSGIREKVNSNQSQKRFSEVGITGPRILV